MIQKCDNLKKYRIRGLVTDSLSSGLLIMVLYAAVVFSAQIMGILSGPDGRLSIVSFTFDAPAFIGLPDIFLSRQAIELDTIKHIQIPRYDLLGAVRCILL